jgi:hypothetical protein
MKGHLFPYEIEAGFFAGYQCERCEGTRRDLNVRFPQVLRNGDEITLVYSFQCACGAPGRVVIRIPLLLYAYARVWKHLINIRPCEPQNKTIRHYCVDGPHCLVTMLKDYERVSERHRTQPRADVSDVDRLLLGMSGEAWREFIRKGDLQEQDEKENNENEEDGENEDEFGEE